MKLLAFGDLHLGAGGDYGREPGDRLRDQQDVLERIVALANENEVDAVLFAGDAFHRRRPTPAELLAFARPLLDLEAPLVAINGNHDVESADLPTALELFHGEHRGTLFGLSTRPEVVHVAGVAIATLPWTPVSRLVAAHGGGDRDRTHEAAAAMLVAAARGLRAEIPAETPAVLLAHWSVTEAVTPTGRQVGPDFGVAIDVDELQGLGFDAVVLGHIHKKQILGDLDHHCAVFYTGSPLPVDFGEANVEHGVYIVEVGTEFTVAPIFHRIESRTFVTVEIDLTTDRHEEIGVDETDAVAAAIATHTPFDDAVVKIRYRATEEQARRIDWPKLRTLLEDAHKVYSISGDIVRSERGRADGATEDLAPLDAVAMWSATVDLRDDQLADIAELSARYLAEVGA